MPSAPRAHSSTGRPPAADMTSRRTEATSRVGRTAISQSTIRIEVAEVDHGNDTATAAASPSATGVSRVRSRLAARLVPTASTISPGPCSRAPAARCHLRSAERRGIPCRRNAALGHPLKARESYVLAWPGSDALNVYLPLSAMDDRRAVPPAGTARSDQPSYPAYTVAAGRVARDPPQEVDLSCRKRKSATGMSD